MRKQEETGSPGKDIIFIRIFKILALLFIYNFRSIVKVSIEDNWKSQTYQKIMEFHPEFEPIIEKPYDEQYDTASGKKRKKIKKSTDKISERLHYHQVRSLRRDKYTSSMRNFEEELEEYEREELQEPKQLMSNGSRRILHNRLKTSIIQSQDDK